MSRKQRRKELEQESSESSENESGGGSEDVATESSSGGESADEPPPKPKARKSQKTGEKNKKAARGKAEKGKSEKHNHHTREHKTEQASDDDGMSLAIVETYRRKITKYIRSDNMFGFLKVLRESPVAVVLHNLHHIFIAASNNDEMVHELVRFNRNFNVVSRKFIRALRETDGCKHKMGEAEGVSEMIQSNTPLRKIPGISDYTPEFIIMATIEAGDLASCNIMLHKWSVSPVFAACKPLLAAFFGWEDFFGKTEKFKRTEDLVVHAMCGGYTRTLQVVTRKSGAIWLVPETLEKACLVCPVGAEMKALFKSLCGRVESSDDEG